MRHDAINLLYSNVHNQVGNLCFDVNGSSVTVDEELVQAKIAELEAAEPLRLLRIERNLILQQSDWRDLPSYPGTDQEAWRTYRQALRDITETQTPELDEFGNLTNITWPEEPA